jgi:hypothetical protein
MTDTLCIVRHDLCLNGRQIRISRDQFRHHSRHGRHTTLDEDRWKAEGTSHRPVNQDLESWLRICFAGAQLTQQALEMILTGLPVTAEEMKQRGIVNRVVSVNEDVLEQALLVAQQIVARSAPALRLAKHAVKAGKSTLRI